MFSLIIHVTSTQIYILERLKFFIVLSKSDDLADRLRGIIIDIVVWKRKKKKRTIIFCILWTVISRINAHGMTCNSINNIAFDFVYLWFDVGRPVASKAEHPVRLIEMEKFDKNLGLFLCYYRVTYPLISVLSHHRTNISRVNGCSLRNTKISRTFWKSIFFTGGR